MNKRDLNKAIKKAGNQTLLAKQLGITSPFLSQMKKGKRPWPKEHEQNLLNYISTPATSMAT